MTCVAIIIALVMGATLAWPLPKHDHEPVIRFLLHHSHLRKDKG